MIIDSSDLAGHSAYDLLKAAAAGTVGIDRRWLHALVDEPAKTLPDLVRFAAEDRSEDRIPLQQDLVSIFQYLKTPLALPFLLDEIRAEPSDISDELVEALVSIGQPAIDPLLRLYDELGDEEGGEVAFLLAGMGIHDPRILDLLVRRMNLDLGDALFQIEVYRDPAAIPALQKRLETTQDEEARLDLSDTIADLREPQPETQLTEFDIWDLYPEEADPDYEVLSEEERMEFLASPSASQRADAATSFFGADYSIHVRAKLLELARQDPDPEVRACCWEAFFDQTEDTELLRLMRARLSDPDTPKRERAGLILGLARHTDQAEVREAILELAEDPDTRERAVETMWRSFDASFGAEAAKYIDDPDIEVRRNAIWAVGYLQVTAGARLLPNFFDDEELRADALHNYALVAPGAVKGLFKKIEAEAKGLTSGEAEAVKAGIDVRLVRAGKKAIYTRDEADEPVVATAKVGRNDPCPCGSGKKYKKCCGQ